MDLAADACRIGRAGLADGGMDGGRGQIGVVSNRAHVANGTDGACACERCNGNRHVRDRRVDLDNKVIYENAVALDVAGNDGVICMVYGRPQARDGQARTQQCHTERHVAPTRLEAKAAAHNA